MQRVDEEAPRYAAAREAGNYYIAAVIAGEACALVHEVLPASEIVARMVAQSTERLRSVSRTR